MFQGSIVALVTPMHDNGQVDDDGLRRLVEFHIENKTDAIVAVGTTGESATLNFDEHCNVIKSVIKYVAGRIPVIAGTGANSTEEALELTKKAKELGADACLLVTPYYNRPPQEGLYQHYKVIAEAVDIPQILYNVPSRTGCDLLPETVARLTSFKNIIGIKEAVNEMSRIDELVALASDEFFVLSGDDATAMEATLRGGKGTISVTANIAPKAMHDLYQYALAGNRAEAEKINDRLMGLHTDLFVEPSPMPAKWAMHQMGLIDSAKIRLPLIPLSEDSQPILKQAMHTAGVL